MYFKSTCKKFFAKDGSYDLYWFFLGLIFIYSFAFFTMPDWIWFTTLSLTILSSAIFRYITTDFIFRDELIKIRDKKDLIAYILSKNIFTILFLAFFVLLLAGVFYIFDRVNIAMKANIDINMLAIQELYVLGTENIILIFSNKLVKSYKKGLRRNVADDISVGLNNFKSMIPSLLSNLIFSIILFRFASNFNIYIAIIYYIVCISVFIICKQKSIDYKVDKTTISD